MREEDIDEALRHIGEPKYYQNNHEALNAFALRRDKRWEQEKIDKVLKPSHNRGRYGQLWNGQAVAEIDEEMYNAAKPIWIKLLEKRVNELTKKIAEI
jgi:hypothetical protein